MSRPLRIEIEGGDLLDGSDYAAVAQAQKRMEKCRNVALMAFFSATIGTTLLFAGTPTEPNGTVPMGAVYALPPRDFNRCMALARSHDGKSCYQLHLHYALALGEQDEGLMWLRRSAEYGYPVGMYGYGVSLWNVAGNNVQKKVARGWISKAAKAGDTSAKEFLRKY